MIKSDRALLFPVYKGTFERRDPRLELTDATPSCTYAEFVIPWMKDVRRSVDYLESRSDIDSERLAYQGLAWEASSSPSTIDSRRP